MSPRDWQVRIEDILGAIAAIEEYVSGMTLADFSADRKTVDAVMHNIMIIGEAAGHIPDDIAALHPEIPWKKMRRIRNVIVHMYFGVRKQVLWDTIQEDLPPLIPLLRGLLSR